MFRYLTRPRIISTIAVPLTANYLHGAPIKTAVTDSMVAALDHLTELFHHGHPGLAATGGHHTMGAAWRRQRIDVGNNPRRSTVGPLGCA